MFICVDSREKGHAIGGILDEFKRQEIPHAVTKLFIGDYMDYANPLLVIDRKQNIAEIAANCTSQHDRFKCELERAKDTGTHLVILIEQNQFGSGKDRKVVRSIEDLVTWKGQHTVVPGDKVYRILNTWIHKYGIEVMFCSRKDTGKRIIEILEGGSDGA